MNVIINTSLSHESNICLDIILELSPLIIMRASTPRQDVGVTIKMMEEGQHPKIVMADDDFSTWKAEAEKAFEEDAPKFPDIDLKAMLATMLTHCVTVSKLPQKEQDAFKLLQVTMKALKDAGATVAAI